MAQQSTSSLDTTEAVTRDRWIPFLAQFTIENRGAHGEVEILGGDPGRLVETEDRPFDGISADVKDNEDTIWIVFGSTPADRLSHGVERVVALRYRPPIGLVGAALEIDSADGTKTLLELSLPEEFALPPAEGKKS